MAFPNGTSDPVPVRFIARGVAVVVGKVSRPSADEYLCIVVDVYGVAQLAYVLSYNVPSGLPFFDSIEDYKLAQNDPDQIVIDWARENGDSVSVASNL